MEKKMIDDKRIEIIMGNLLRFGVFLSALVVCTGSFIYLFQHGSATPQYRTFEGEPKRLTELHSILTSALNGRGRSIIQFGLLLLISTPIVRIIFSIIGFIMERDLLYALITLVVLATIMVGLF
ncbi:hypothetical protein A3860_13895 [Niastella vici]|uniref:DUF1634 domain-containing protein n=1 Tax=Niastella vici TaxID=1703345 RepID=A0A1V9G7W0_9BACT|nr:DUF1634 domain-containing protein [Niastella vici]OQP66568.1 hypothetical protein A3860_13895 [Niastella vici]